MMTTLHRRKQYHARHARKPVTFEELQMSNRAIGFLCALAAFGTFLILMLMIFGDKFLNAFGG
ncbi:hypothetical protein F0160_22520 [Paraburkholderia sp. JPY303]|uniref:hypothetical protein n=1 Tax=Paraburkholderia atlantica TaxID=2654982 RepID=UPI001591AE49|nr:hypothetical protein [Paraburkholderia atlantica]NUY33262.1 hypothetical protein [Paraburkholderia atlantica]